VPHVVSERRVGADGGGAVTGAITLGATVEWTSQAGGSATTKRGVVVWRGVVNPRRPFSAYREDTIPRDGWRDDCERDEYLMSAVSRRRFDRVRFGLLVLVSRETGPSPMWYAPRANKRTRVVDDA